MFKKAFFIAAVNIIIILIILEITAYFYNTRTYIVKPSYSWYKIQSFDKVYEMIRDQKMRKPIGLNHKNRPILLLGCSYTYGYKLNENESFAYFLSKGMKRPVYNRAFEWNWGVNTMLYQARRPDFYNEVPNPEYIIYTLTVDHIEKAHCSCYDPAFPYPQVRYIMKNGRLEREKIPFIYNLHMFKFYTLHNLYRKNGYTQIYMNNAINEFFIETKQEFDKHWKDYKFIILIYERDKEYLKSEHKNWDELEKHGFTVISTSDLTGRVMDRQDDFISDNYHPSSEAWKLIVPKLIERIKKIK